MHSERIHRPLGAGLVLNRANGFRARLLEQLERIVLGDSFEVAIQGIKRHAMLKCCLSNNQVYFASEITPAEVDDDQSGCHDGDAEGADHAARYGWKAFCQFSYLIWKSEV